MIIPKGPKRHFSVRDGAAVVSFPNNRVVDRLSLDCLGQSRNRKDSQTCQNRRHVTVEF